MENEKFYKNNRKTNIDSVASSEHGDTAENEQKLMAEMNPSGLQQMDSVDDETLRGEESFVFSCSQFPFEKYLQRKQRTWTDFRQRNETCGIKGDSM